MTVRKRLYAIDVLCDGIVSFPERLAAAFAAEGLDYPYTVFDGVGQYESLPDLVEQEDLAGILISGSVKSAYEQLPWMLALEELVRRAHARQIPLLGICFGHQILATALGGSVQKLPRIREFGTLPVYLYPSDEHPWLLGFSSGTMTSQTHQDHVAELPPGATVHGFSQLTPHQIFSVGSCLGVQFHPEYTEAELKQIGQARQHIYLQEQVFHNPEHLSHFLTTLTPTAGARVVLRNFVKSLP